MDRESMVDPKQEAFITKNPREAAYFAVWLSIREESFVQQVLNRWKAEAQPKAEDFALARAIAYGTVRMSLALDHLAQQLTDKETLKLKLQEKVLVRNALYQFHFMDKIPLYAIANETMELAKKYCHPTFVRFLNAILRRLEEKVPALPEGNTIPEISTRYSYPPFFVQELIQNYGLERALTILEVGNLPTPTMVRVRPTAAGHIEEKEGVTLLAGTPCPIALIEDVTLLKEISTSPDYYIQNVTPAVLVEELSQKGKKPSKILDLCASPGGKLLAFHDKFPEAELFGNDVTAEKVKMLAENCEKYGVKAHLSCISGENYPADQSFDVVIIDAPCSNSGVLNKRAEARWRLTPKKIEELEHLQMKLIERATQLIQREGAIWYMTCSILKKENGALIKKACEAYGLEATMTETIFPNADGWDGGFAAILYRS